MNDNITNIGKVILVIGILGVGSITVVQQMNYNNLNAEYQELLAQYEVTDFLFEEIFDNYETTMAELLNTLDELSTLNNTYNQLSEWYQSLISSHIMLAEDYGMLNNTYYDLLDEMQTLEELYVNLLADYDILQAEYDSLLDDYNNLVLDHQTLSTSYDTLTVTYQNLLDNFNVLNVNYNQLQSEFDSLNITYWELWESAQPNYEVVVVEYVVPYHTMLYNISVSVIVSLEFISNSLPVEDGIVIINGYQCSYLGAGMWNTTIMKSTVSTLILDNVVYVNSTGSVVGVDQNNQMCALYWVDTFSGYTRNPVIYLCNASDSYGSFVGFEVVGEHEFYLYGESVTNSWSITDLILPDSVTIFVDGNPIYSEIVRLTWVSQRIRIDGVSSTSQMYLDSFYVPISGDGIIDIFDNQTTSFDMPAIWEGYSHFLVRHQFVFQLQIFDGQDWIGVVNTECESYNRVTFGTVTG